MIKNILLPERIGNYYLFAKRIVGFEITKQHVFATVVYLNGNKRTIEKCISMPIEQDNGEDTTVRTAQAIKKVLGMAGKYNEIYTSISSAHIIYKSMRLPFEEVDKIKKVINFEVEPLLPFSIADAVVDFIITKKLPEQNSSEVIVAAVQKQYISGQIELFSQAGVHPEVITVDLFELYGLYNMIPAYKDIKNNVVLTEINDELTKIAFINEGQLRFIRTLPMGINSIAQKLASELSLSPRDASEQFTRFGFNNHDEAYMQALRKGSEAFAKRIQFTLQSFATQVPMATENTQMFLLGNGATIEGLSTWLHTTLNMPCSLFKPTDITQNDTVYIKNMVTIPLANTVSTSIALPSPTSGHLNLRQKEFAPSGEKLLLKQLILASLLSLGLFIGLFAYSFFQVRKLSNELEASKIEASQELTKWFPQIDPGSIGDMLETAQEETTKEERLWFSFARSAHNSFLSLLLELTGLDREGLGLIIEKITIDQDRGTMNLKAQVKDHEALVHLENELNRSDLFDYVQPQDNPNFNMELRFAAERQGDS